MQARPIPTLLGDNANHAFFQQSNELLPLVMLQNDKLVVECLKELELQSPQNSWKNILRRRTITDIYCQTWERISPLQFAAYSGNTKLVKEMISRIPAQYIGQALAQVHAVSLFEGEDDGLSVRVQTSRK